MNIKPIRNDKDLRDAFERLEFVYQAKDGTPEADEMEILVTLIEAYEHKHFPIGVVDPVEAVKQHAILSRLGWDSARQATRLCPARVRPWDRRGHR